MHGLTAYLSEKTQIIPALSLCFRCHACDHNNTFNRARRVRIYPNYTYLSHPQRGFSRCHACGYKDRAPCSA